MAHMANVTLGHEQVEWFDPDMDEAKSALFDDGRFLDYIEGHGVALALERVSKLHRVVANQLIRLAITDPADSDWAARAIWLCGKAKYRRRQLRRRYAETFDTERLALFIQNFNTLHPRAVWGSQLTATPDLGKRTK